MKIFYTERDIEDMHAQGVKEIRIDDNTMFTDLAMDKAIAVGIKLLRHEEKRVVADNDDDNDVVADDDLVARIKVAVIARLGTHAHDALLDKIIPMVWLG